MIFGATGRRYARGTKKSGHYGCGDARDRRRYRGASWHRGCQVGRSRRLAWRSLAWRRLGLGWRRLGPWHRLALGLAAGPGWGYYGGPYGYGPYYGAYGYGGDCVMRRR